MSGRLILVCGLPGSGKSTLSRELEQTLGAVRLSPDEWLQSLRLDGYDVPARTRLEALQRELAMRLLALGCTVILENGFWGRGERDSLRDEARALGAAVELRYLDVPFDELWRRVDARNRHLPFGSFAITRDNLETWATTQFEAPTPEELATYDR
jgi:predicted kinase